jgi:cytochrome c-type biogenesis protein CcmH
MKKFLLLLARLVILTVFFASHFSIRVVSAQQPTPSDDDVNRVAKQLYCPVCENTPLDVCPTQACQEWRALIYEKLAEGWSDEQVIEYFALQYGDRVLAAPPARGINWLIYAMPPVFFLAGVIVVIGVLRRMRSQTPGAQTAATPTLDTTDDYLRRVEEELKRAEKQ